MGFIIHDNREIELDGVRTGWGALWNGEETIVWLMGSPLSETLQLAERRYVLVGAERDEQGIPGRNAFERDFRAALDKFRAEAVGVPDLDLMDAAQAIASITDMDGHYTAALQAHISEWRLKTGKQFAQMSVAELIAMNKCCNDFFNKHGLHERRT